MTRPNIVAFGFDGPQGPPRVFLRTLLYSTSRRGHVIEGMFAKVQQNGAVRTFTDWGYGDSQIVFGSGVHIPYEGMACNHRFLLPKNVTDYAFLPGEYTVEVYATIANNSFSARSGGGWT